MLFDRFNAPSTFIRLMNKVLRPFIKKFMVGYFDDILVHIHDKASHVEHLSQVFQILEQQTLYAKLKKCKYSHPKLFFLGLLSPKREFKLMSLRLML